jgi:hypothetical protein
MKTRSRRFGCIALLWLIVCLSEKSALAESSQGPPHVAPIIVWIKPGRLTGPQRISLTHLLVRVVSGQPLHGAEVHDSRPQPVAIDAIPLLTGDLHLWKPASSGKEPSLPRAER